MQQQPFNLLKSFAARRLFPFLLAAALSVSAAAQSTESSKKILTLFTHQSDNPAQVIVEQAMRSTLQSGLATAPEIYSEYLDAVRTPLEGGYENDLVKQLQHKYKDKKFDLIFAINRPALQFLIKNRAALAPDTPIVFLVLDQQNVSDLDAEPHVTGVWSEVNYTATLELALGLHPGTKHVVVISGVGDWDNYWRSVVQQQLQPFEDRVEISYLTGLTIPEQKEALSRLPPESIVLFMSSTRDKAGNSLGNLEVLKQICPVSNAPVYGTSDAQLGLGIVGGKVMSFQELGTEGAQVGLRVLNGESADHIASYGVPSIPMFDWLQLQRWGISEKILPEGSVIRFRQPSVWEEYKWYILGTICLLLAETLLIGLLIYLRFRRRQAETEAVRIGGRLADIVSNVPGIVWESRSVPGTKPRKTTFISDFVEKILGYTPEMWLKQEPGFGLTIVVDEDRERVERESDEVMETGTEAVSEYRWIAKDGNIRWVENHIAPLVEGSNIVGLRGVALDITDRKLAEEKAHQAEEKDRAILAAIPDLMFLQSDDGVFLDYHAKEPDDLIVPPEEFMGRNMRDFMPPDLASKITQCFAQAKDGGGAQVLQYNIDLGKGDKWFESRMVRMGDKILSVVRDITDLKRAQFEAEEISGRLISAHEDERARIALELHDDACQSLAVLGIELELFNRIPLDQETVIRAKRQLLAAHVDELSSHLRRLSHQLHPSWISAVGLVTAVHGFCTEMENAHGLEIKFVEAKVPRPLPDPISLNIYRIVQEALQNVARHSGAKEAAVTIFGNDRTLQLSISDNGCGFDTGITARGGSLGLISVRERVRLMHGSLSIDSGPGRGTRIDATIPIKLS